MLQPDYFEGKEEKILMLYRKLEDFILRDIARRVIASGQLPPTADRLIWKLEQMGEHKAEILKHLTALTKSTTAEMKAILQEAVMTSWEDDATVYEEMGIEVSNPLENQEVITVMDAEYQKTLGELQNLTRTTMDQSQQDLINLMDDAEMRVSSGVQSYNQAISDVLDEYAGKGVKVTYPTGTERTLEAAVRCAVVTSINQTAAQVSNQYIKETGVGYILTSAHWGARVKRPGQPDLAGHDLWQGRVFSIVGSEPGFPNLLESTGYDIDPVTGQGKVVNPLGLHGYNCRHSHRPWDKTMKNPWRDEEGNLIDGSGNQITSEKNREKYENSQKQRAMERAIRKTKRQLLMKQEQIDSIAETDVKEIYQDEYNKLADRLTKQNKAYNDFCADKNLQPQYDRNKVAGFGAKQQRQANARAKAYRKGD